MALNKALILFTILFTSCNTAMRKIDVCLVQGPIAECAKDKKKYQLQYPSQMITWECWSLEAHMLLGEQLTRCEEDGRLPSNDQTWDKMEVCEIYADKLVPIPCKKDMDAYLCTNKEGSQKIQSKLTWCSRR